MSSESDASSLRTPEDKAKAAKVSEADASSSGSVAVPASTCPGIEGTYAVTITRKTDAVSEPVSAEGGTRRRRYRRRHTKKSKKRANKRKTRSRK